MTEEKNPSKKVGFSTNKPEIKMEVQRLANENYNGNFSAMMVQVILAGLEGIRSGAYTLEESPAGQ